MGQSLGVAFVSIGETLEANWRKELGDDLSFTAKVKGLQKKIIFKIHSCFYSPCPTDYEYRA